MNSLSVVLSALSLSLPAIVGIALGAVAVIAIFAGVALAAVKGKKEKPIEPAAQPRLDPKSGRALPEIVTDIDETELLEADVETDEILADASDAKADDAKSDDKIVNDDKAQSDVKADENKDAKVEIASKDNSAPDVPPSVVDDEKLNLESEDATYTGNWDNYSGEYANYYYDEVDGCYYEGVRNEVEMAEKIADAKAAKQRQAEEAKKRNQMLRDAEAKRIEEARKAEEQARIDKAKAEADAAAAAAEAATAAAAAEEAKKAEEEAKKAEEERKATEAVRAAEEAKKAAEEARLAEEKKIAEEREAAAQKAAEDARKEAEEKDAKEAEEKRIADEEAAKKAEAEKQAEEERKAAEAKKAEEDAKKAEEDRAAAEAKAEEERLAAEAKKAEDDAKKAEDERAKAEKEAEKEKAKAEREAQLEDLKRRMAEIDAKRAQRQATLPIKSAPKAVRMAPEAYTKGFDESVIYGKYVIEHAGDQYFFTLYDNKGGKAYESYNYRSKEAAEADISRFKKASLLGTFSIEKGDDGFFYRIVKGQRTFEGPAVASRAAAEKSLQRAKDYALTDISREQ